VGLSQPWRFVRIETPALRERLAAHVDAQIVKAGQIYKGDEDRLYRSLKLHGLWEAPVLFAVYCDEGTETGHKLGAITMPEARRYSCVMAIHTIWLAARTRGIGMGWISILDRPTVDAMLEVPENWRCLGLLCLGYPESEEATPELERRGWEYRTDWHSTIVNR
jgi:5,6-dimethylbenzimidazole synthase